MPHTKQLNIDDGGSGSIPIIFLHSFAGSTHQWLQQLSYFRENGRAIAFDLPGHGWSAPPRDDDYSVAAYAETLALVIDNLNLSHVVLVGHSLGGAVAISYAASHADRVVGLIVEEAPGKLPDEQVAKIQQSLDADYAGAMEKIWTRLLTDAKPATRKQVLRDRERISEAASRAIIKETFAYDPLPDLARFRSPVLSIISSNGDVPTALHKLSPDISHAQIDGTSHWVHMDKPKAFNEAVSEFLATLPIPISSV